jgi:CRISPR-associated protein Csm3
MVTPNQFFGKYVISGLIRCMTGLHIGATDTGIEIGGLDNPVVKDPITDQPYIPGSSLKGKLRSLVEWSFGLIKPHPDHDGGYMAYDCRELKTTREETEDSKRWDRAYKVGRLFGPSTNETEIRKRAGPTRLTVRDAFLDEDSVKVLERAQGSGVYTEVKTENAIDRVTSEANPRPLERVPAQTDFRFTLMLDIYQEEDLELLQTLFSAMALVEESFLGGGGSRGHGQIQFKDLEVRWRPVAYYTEGAASKFIKLEENGDVHALVADFDVTEWR